MIEIVLFPIIYVMRTILELGYALFNSYGVAIIILSLVVTIATQPLARFAARIQKQENARQQEMRPEIDAAKSKYKGEEQFRAIEEIYDRHGYHPIHSIKEVFGVVLQIPFLLAALVLLYDYEPLNGVSFAGIADLSKPDGLLPLPAGLPIESINLLPFLTAALSIAAGYFMSNVASQSRWKGNVVAIVILIIIYMLPAAVVFYWTMNNLWLLLNTTVTPHLIDFVKSKLIAR